MQIHFPAAIQAGADRRPDRNDRNTANDHHDTQPQKINNSSEKKQQSAIRIKQK